jgi:site-specific recombinase XerD
VTEVQALLGHESVATTSIYTRLSAADVLEAARVAPGADIG